MVTRHFLSMCEYLSDLYAKSSYQLEFYLSSFFPISSIICDFCKKVGNRKSIGKIKQSEPVGDSVNICRCIYILACVCVYIYSICIIHIPICNLTYM